MEKQEYIPAELEVIQFNTEDIIITSGTSGGRDNNDPDW